MMHLNGPNSSYWLNVGISSLARRRRMRAESHRPKDGLAEEQMDARLRGHDEGRAYAGMGM
jgi:hypothetical protein